MTNYLFRGALTGILCGECAEPISGATIRIYRVRAGQDAVRLAAADPKRTFRVLSADEVREKQGALLAEAETDAAGAFRIELGEQQQYGGEALEIDLVATTMPGSIAAPRAPVQATITVVSPEWRARENGRVAAWDYAIPQRFWCALRALFDAWVICGRVGVCDTKQPAVGVKVLAFDRDWLKDDPLGIAITDANGRFRIDYSGADFRQGTWLDLELVGGPDVYFHVESPAGGLVEPPSMGRTPGRENIGPCFCVELCVKEAPIVRHAWFTRVGDFHIYSDIDSATGLTLSAQPAGFPSQHGGPGYGFWGAMNLVGDCPVAHPSTSAAMRYRFLARPAGGAAQPITGAAVAAVKIGSRPVPWNFGSGVQTYSQDIVVGPTGGYAGPMPAPMPSPPSPMPPGSWGSMPALVLSPDANGWVTMPPDATNQGFSGTLLRFNSGAIVAGSQLPPHDGAGNAVSPANQRRGTDVELIFEAEPVTGPAAGATLSNSLPRLHINNWFEVAQLELVQFTLPGATPCSGITSGIDLRYTVDHELIADWHIDLITSAVPPPSPVLPGIAVSPVPAGEVKTARGGHGTHHVDTTAWPECAYGITFTRRLKLTDGVNDDPGRAPLVAMFCKRDEE